MASRWHRIAWIFSGLALPSCLWADPVGLLYPDVRDPYQKVFLNIAEGAEAQLGTSLYRHILSKSTTSQETESWLAEKDISAVIALGADSVNFLNADNQLPLVVGAVSAQAPESFSSVSLNPSPKLLFAGVLALQHSIKTIHVVFDPSRNNWEVEQAAEMAKALNIKLIGYPAEDLRQAATTYRDIQNQMDAKTEALWLPLGGPARDKTIMQTILEIAWVNEQVIFSSNLADVKRGVLFAMYPDNTGMGKELAQLLTELQKNPEQPHQTQFVTSLYKAVNRRTAEHLQIRLGNQDLSAYDFVYPPR